MNYDACNAVAVSLRAKLRSDKVVKSVCNGENNVVTGIRYEID